ncbi:MAG TPA: YceI family protein [Microlunatus sp.]|jgi:polyisoprenoid-binding protein YceI|nr:YceI family protein [Microlunatus sp.]
MTQQIATTGLITGTWTIDASHSEVGFSVRHLMSKVKGRFTEFEGTITTTSENPVDGQVEVTITSGSITTGNDQRDAHLKSADFFDPTNGGTLAFVSTGIAEGTNGYVISGDLTINGITKPVDLAAEFLGVAVDAFGATRLGAEATTSIDRKDFNVTFNIPLDGGKLLIGDKVDITLAIEAVKA